MFYPARFPNHTIYDFLRIMINLHENGDRWGSLDRTPNAINLNLPSLTPHAMHNETEKRNPFEQLPNAFVIRRAAVVKRYFSTVKFTVDDLVPVIAVVWFCVLKRSRAFVHAHRAPDICLQKFGIGVARYCAHRTILIDFIRLWFGRYVNNYRAIPNSCLQLTYV